MKKIYLALLGCAFSLSVVAQDVTTSDAPVLKSKRGENFLPETSEWGLGISANPFLDYLGNFINGTEGNDAPDFEYGDYFTDNLALYGKYMKDANTAYRIRFNVNITTETDKQVVLQDEVSPAPGYPAFAEDWRKVSNLSIVIAPGYEKRRGSTRLQGVYGGELVFGLSRTNIEYQYGNSINADFPDPTRTDFGPNDLGGGAWTTEYKSGLDFLVGARGFIGIEYFFAPKISIGGEFGYMLGLRTQGKSSTTAEVWDPATNRPRSVELDATPSDDGYRFSSIGVGLDNLSGSINLLFYF